MNLRKALTLGASVALVSFLAAPVTASGAPTGTDGEVRTQAVASGWSPATGGVSAGSAAARAAIGAATTSSPETIPYWGSSFDYQGTSYPYVMVGTNPLHPSVTAVPAVLIPIDLTFENAGPNVNAEVDATGRMLPILQSPIFQLTHFAATGDTTQFSDAVSRAEWSSLLKSPSPYHVLLAPGGILPAVHITVPSNIGQVTNPGDGIPRGEVNLDWWSQLIPNLVTSLGISPKVLPIFVTSDTGAGLEAGFHGAFETTSPNHPPSISTYVWSSWFDPGWFSIFGLRAEIGADTDVLSHEVTEWVNDPFLDNIVPEWQFSAPPILINACSDLLETGDPLEETPFAVSVSGRTYHLQDAAFFSYFARQSPSLGYRGRYSFLGTLKTFSSPCSTPGT